MSRRLYQDALDLFTRYPLAVDHFGCIPQMAMVLVDGEDAWTLHHVANGIPHPFFGLWHWGDEDELVIRASGDLEIRGDIGPFEAEKILARTTPFPEDGSMFGWVDSGAVTAIVPCYADSEDDERPCFSLMPRHGVPAENWPPITAAPHFGGWFWDHHRAGRLVPLGDLIAAAPGDVLWVSGAAPDGSDICAVTRDIGSPEGFTLPAGYYAYYKELRAGIAEPSLLLRQRPPGIDLAPRFARRSVQMAGAS